MKIRILKSTVCDGKNVTAGDEVDASSRAANILIGLKFAEEYTEQPKKRGRKPQSEVNRMAEVPDVRDAG